jgi:hypothetical protein
VRHTESVPSGACRSGWGTPAVTRGARGLPQRWWTDPLHRARSD